MEKLVEEIENARELLNSMIGSKTFSGEEILQMSQLLDLLIVRYYREAKSYFGKWA